MTGINPYLNFDGNAEEAFSFYKSVFGGENAMLQRFSDMPGNKSISDSEKNKVLHFSLPIGKNSVLMGSDIPGHMNFKLNYGNNFYISVNTESEEETTKLFNKLGEGGAVHMPLDKTFWGAFFGMVADKFGIQWMISYTYEQK